MRASEGRDEQTLAIVRALLIFVGIVGAGYLALALLEWLVEIDDGIAQAVLMLLVIVAAAIGARDIVRQR